MPALPPDQVWRQLAAYSISTYWTFACIGWQTCDKLQTSAIGRQLTLEFAAERAIFRFEPGLVAAREIGRLVDDIVARDAALEGAELRIDPRDVGVGPVGDLLKARNAKPIQQHDEFGPDALQQLQIVGPVLRAAGAGLAAGDGGTAGSAGMAAAAFAGAGLAAFFAAGSAAAFAAGSAGFATGSLAVTFFAAGFAAAFGFFGRFGRRRRGFGDGCGLGGWRRRWSGCRRSDLGNRFGRRRRRDGLRLRLDRFEARGFGGNDFGLYRFERFRGLRLFDNGRSDLFGFRAAEQPPEQHDGNDEADDRDNPVFLKPNHDLLRL